MESFRVAQAHLEGEGAHPVPGEEVVGAELGPVIVVVVVIFVLK